MKRATERWQLFQWISRNISSKFKKTVVCHFWNLSIQQFWNGKSKKLLRKNTSNCWRKCSFMMERSMKTKKDTSIPRKRWCLICCSQSILHVNLTCLKMKSNNPKLIGWKYGYPIQSSWMMITYLQCGSTLLRKG